MTENILSLLSQCSKIAGFELQDDLIKLEIWEAGIKSHIPKDLPEGFNAVYIFKWKHSFLKVGRTSPGSKNRYKHHHYNPKNSQSNLSKSLLNDYFFKNQIKEKNVDKWIKQNTSRYNVLIPTLYGNNFLNFAEAFFILKFNPKYEV